MNQIVVDGLVKRFGHVTAVDGVSLRVGAGEIFGLLGPNGAGKTTIIGVLTTLLRPSSGYVSVCGFSAEHEPDQVRRSIGVVFQDQSLDVRLTAWENLRLHARLYALPELQWRSRANELLAMVELVDWRDAIVRTFSGGMRRRLELVRSLLHEPRMLILDEPTVGLDPQSREHLWQRLAQLRAQGVTVLVTTHYMDEAERCDRLAIIDHGRIVSIGTPGELKRAVGGNVVTLNTTDNRKAAAALERRFGLTPRLVGGRIHLTVPAQQQFLSTLVTDLDVPIVSISMGAPSLDDVFLGVTGSAVRDRAARSETGSGHAAATIPTGPGPSRGLPARTRAGGLYAAVRSAYGLWARDMIRYRRDRLRLAAGLAQPLFFLFVFATALAPVVKGLGPGGLSYVQFVFPGMLTMAALMTTMYSAMSIVWDREAGILRAVIVAPAPRAALVMGKVLGASTTGLLQALLLLGVAPAAGVQVSAGTVPTLVGVLFVTAFAWGAMGLALAGQARTVDAVPAVMNFVVMPLFFLSGALFPTDGLPRWLGLLVRLNPFAYGVDAVRGVLHGSGGAWGRGGGALLDVPYRVLTDLGIVSAMALLLLIASSRALGERA